MSDTNATPSASPAVVNHAPVSASSATEKAPSKGAKKAAKKTAPKAAKKAKPKTKAKPPSKAKAAKKPKARNAPAPRKHWKGVPKGVPNRVHLLAVIRRSKSPQTNAGLSAKLGVEQKHIHNALSSLKSSGLIRGKRIKGAVGRAIAWEAVPRKKGAK